MSFKLQTWQTVLRATVDMRVASCPITAQGISEGDLTLLAKGAKLHKSGERIARAYRPKDGGA